MSYPELLKQKFGKAGVQGAAASWRGLGYPQKLFFLLLRAAAGGARGERKKQGTPLYPGLGRPPFAIPLLGRLERHRTPVRKVRDNS